MKGWIIFILVLFSVFAIIFSLLIFGNRIPRENLIIFIYIKESFFLESLYKSLKASLLISTQKVFQNIEVKYDGTKTYMIDIKKSIEENFTFYANEIQNLVNNDYYLKCNKYVDKKCYIEIKSFEEYVETDNISIEKTFKVPGITEKEIQTNIKKNFSLKIRPEITFKQIDEKIDNVINELNKIDEEMCNQAKSNYNYNTRDCSETCKPKDDIIRELKQLYIDRLKDTSKRLSDENFFINSTEDIKIDFDYKIEEVNDNSGNCLYYKCNLENINFENEGIINIEGRGVLLKPKAKINHSKSCQ